MIELRKPFFIDAKKLAGIYPANTECSDLLRKRLKEILKKK